MTKQPKITSTHNHQHRFSILATTLAHVNNELLHTEQIPSWKRIRPLKAERSLSIGIPRQFSPPTWHGPNNIERPEPILTFTRVHHLPNMNQLGKEKTRPKIDYASLKLSKIRSQKNGRILVVWNRMTTLKFPKTSLHNLYDMSIPSEARPTNHLNKMQNGLSSASPAHPLNSLTAGTTIQALFVDPNSPTSG